MEIIGKEMSTFLTYGTQGKACVRNVSLH